MSAIKNIFESTHKRNEFKRKAFDFCGESKISVSKLKSRENDGFADV